MAALFAVAGSAMVQSQEPPPFCPPGDAMLAKPPATAKIDSGTAALRSWSLSPAAPVAEAMTGSIRRVGLETDDKLIALTFDLCETAGAIAGFDAGIVDYLRANDVKATFFTSGKWFTTHASTAAEMIGQGRFEFANHGWSHRDMRQLSGAALREEIVFAQAAYERLRAGVLAGRCVNADGESGVPISPRMSLLRFPFGTCNAEALRAVAEQGLLAVQWDVVTGDPDPGRSARAIAATVLRQARPGSIIVAHANGRGWHTAAALPLIVPALRQQGYRFVTVSELVAAGKPEIADSCYENRPGDQRASVATGAPRAARPRPPAYDVRSVFFANH